MPPRTFASHDYYAKVRCRCGHLIYADQVIGEDCRFCDCTSHGLAPEADPDPSEISLPREPAPPVTTREAG